MPWSKFCLNEMNKLVKIIRLRQGNAKAPDRKESIKFGLAIGKSAG